MVFRGEIWPIVEVLSTQNSVRRCGLPMTVMMMMMVEVNVVIIVLMMKTKIEIDQSVTFVKILTRTNIRRYLYQKIYTNKCPNIF